MARYHFSINNVDRIEANRTRDGRCLRCSLSRRGVVYQLFPVKIPGEMLVLGDPGVYRRRLRGGAVNI